MSKTPPSGARLPRGQAPSNDPLVDGFLRNYAMRGLHPAARDPLGVVGGHAGHDLGALTPALALGALGVVFGDIGTSPLYAIKACFHDGAFAPSETNILGVLSLVFWSLMLVVTLKYVLFIMRADHKGEGGLFALFNLLRKDGNHFSARSMKLIVLCTLAGAALFFGDGMITPAISVLSAVEGLGYATDVARPAVLPLTAAILVGLYALQRRGTGGIGRLFGPVMLTWFAAIALLGIGQIARAPEVLAALAPHHALDFLFRHGLSGFAVLGSVVLCITGCEALYADMGHFGAQPIRVSWFSVVLPALTLNYFGQGAGLLLDPAIASNPFYGIVPGALRIPMVLLASMATICASQAMISGVFSLARHAILLDYLPRMRVMRTSWIIPGQIYIPAINTIMMCASVLLVFAFRESANMAGAFGLAVTGTMVVTTCLYFFVITRNWKWPLWIAASLVSGFLILDLLFFGTNLLKVVSGGWFVLLAACAAMLCMLASKRHQDGNWRLTLSRGSIPLETFMRRLGEIALARAPGTAVFLGVEAANTPKSLVDILGERGVLHENVVIVCLRRTGDPTVEAGKRLAVRHLGLGVHQIVARYGFMEHPNVPELLDEAESHGVPHDPALVYYLGGQSRPKAGHGPWENVLDAVGGLLFRGEPPAFTSFGIPAARVITEAGDVE